MGHVDLDAARAARDEARGDMAVTLGGREFKLRSELTIDAAAAWRENEARKFVELILADPSETDDFLANNVSWADLSSLLDAYGTSPGESEAS